MDMEPIRDPKILARARDAFDLCQFVEDVTRHKIRRQYPQASEEEIRQRFRAWLEKRDYVEESSQGEP